MVDERKARNRELSAGLLRQRRNLMVLSALAPLFVIGEIQVDSVNLFGTVFTIDYPSLIYLVVLVAFAYSLIRYLQYYSEELFTRDAHRLFKVCLYDLESRILAEKAKKTMGIKAQGVALVSFSNHKYQRYSIWADIPNTDNSSHRVVFRNVEVLASQRQPDPHDEKARVAFVEAMDSELSWSKAASKTKSQSENSYRNFVLISVPIMLLARAFGIFRYVLFSSYLTDYQLPIFLAALSILAMLLAIAL